MTRAITGDRCSGKTTKLIVRICELQDEGHEVIVLVPNSQYVRWWLDAALDLPRGDGIDPSRCTMLLATMDVDRSLSGTSAKIVAEDIGNIPWRVWEHIRNHYPIDAYTMTT